MAGRIPQHFIDQLLNRIDVVDLIDGYVPLKKAGANYKACCPFHNEKSPSFTVSPSKQFYHCFGCGMNGTAISFLMEYDHMEFREAIEKLASTAGMEIPTEAQDNYKPKNTVREGVDLYQLMNEVSDFYQQQLRQHSNKQQAVEYLKNRGLSGDIAKRFGLGFAPEGWDNLMTSHGSTVPTQKALLDTGMLTHNEEKNKTYDRFRHRIMFPIHDHRGRVVGFGGRVLDSGEPKYLNSPETPIFHKGSELYGLFSARGAIKESESVLVVEGYMDVVALAQAGINNAVATLGTATTPMHLQRLFRHTSNIIFSFDGDRAGKAAAWKALETCLPLLQDGYQISFLFLPDGEDPDTMVKKVGKDGFIDLINAAKPLTDFLIDHLQQQADLSRLDGRARLAKLAKPMIEQFPDGVLRKLVIERIARLIQIAPQELIANKAADSYRPNTRKQQSGSVKKSLDTSAKLQMTTIRRAISLLLQNPDLANLVNQDSPIKTLRLRGIELLNQLLGQAQEQTDMTTARLLERHRQESHFGALEKLASHDHLLTTEQTEAAFMAVLNQLHAESSEIELDGLLDKSQHESLNENEKARLNELLAKKT